MYTLYQKNVAPIEVHSDGRRFKRFVREESVSIVFRDQKATGNLVNLSPAGLFATFPKDVPLPSLAENVMINIDLDDKGNALDINGSVVRIQPPRMHEANDHIGVAVDFSGLDRAAKFRIGSIINYLLVKDHNYNT